MMRKAQQPTPQQFRTAEMGEEAPVQFTPHPITHLCPPTVPLGRDGQAFGTQPNGGNQRQGRANQTEFEIADENTRQQEPSDLSAPVEGL